MTSNKSKKNSEILGYKLKEYLKKMISVRNGTTMAVDLPQVAYCKVTHHPFTCVGDDKGV